MSEYIDFSIPAARFAPLQRAFAELKRNKDVDDWRSNEELLEFFDAESLGSFVWLQDDRRRQRLEDLRTRPILLTPTNQAVGAKWDFDSLIDSFVNGEYELLNCERSADGDARLKFNAWAYPYGGVGCLVALIEAFDGVVTGIEDGTGYVVISPKR
ncbi:hypothetical protein NA78x_001058 [Anatilimnocola sp. NA78]|uniref:hypothetical protein n=1 Tax=Anatilimnocola sp. NA78 TaxID=3415683 RepID=UPI003CE5AC35